MFWENFLRLCEQRNEKPNPVAEKLNISSGTVTRWKKGSEPQPMTLKKVADYFGVTPQDLLSDAPALPRGDAQMLDQSGIHLAPLFETVSAGFGAFAENQAVDYIPVYVSKKSEAAETICIRVSGDSMYPVIDDGDIIQVRKQDNVISGSVAVVLVDGDEGFVKNVYYEEDKWVELRSINPMYPVMRYEGRDMEKVRVVGFVTKVIKNINQNVIAAEEAAPQRTELDAILDDMDADQLEQFHKLLGVVIDAKIKGGKK